MCQKAPGIEPDAVIRGPQRCQCPQEVADSDHFMAVIDNEKHYITSGILKMQKNVVMTRYFLTLMVMIMMMMMMMIMMMMMMDSL
jgi:hypothetical protein